MLVLHPKQEEAMSAIQSEEYNFILFGGAIRGGKTVWGLSAFLILCEIFPRSRWCVIREDIEKIRTTTIPSFKKLEASGKLRESPYEYKHPNGSVILFKSENFERDKNLDWMKGLEVNGILFEEINECQQQTLFKAFERVGSWIIPHAEIQPNPIVIATCNPTFGWVKTLVYDRWKNGTLPPRWLYIPSKITDNPSLPQAYINNLKNLPKYEYMVFVEGNWDIQLKTGGEFWKSFDANKHVENLNYVEAPVHISVDNNVLPYISSSIWQIVNEQIDEFNHYHIRQIAEVAAKDPYNTVTRAAQLVVKYLKSIGHEDKVFIYGDQTTTANNTIDEDKRSFFDKYCEVFEDAGFIIERRMPSANPSVPLSGEFINGIFDGNIPDIDIKIDDECKYSIIDYTITKQDVNGGILKKRIRDPKTKQSYEESGHFSDTMRYVICEAFKDKYISYSLRRNRNEFKDETMKFYDPNKTDLIKAESYIRIVPDTNGMFCMVVARYLEKRIYITDVLFNNDPSASKEKVVKCISNINLDEISFESPAVWFDYGRELRNSTDSSVRIITEVQKKDIRIAAHSEFIKSNMYFRNDYDLFPDYSAFMDNLHECYKGESIEAANALSGVAEYFNRKYV